MVLAEAIQAFEHPMPAGVGYECGENDGADSLSHNVPEKNLDEWDEQQQDE